MNSSYARVYSYNADKARFKTNKRTNEGKETDLQNNSEVVHLPLISEPGRIRQLPVAIRFEDRQEPLPPAQHTPHSEPVVTEVSAGIPKTAPSSPGPNADESTDEEEEMTIAELETEAKILGTKEFVLDDALLDDYLTRVLAWWYGRRPPQGVDVELTRRCV